MAKVEAHLKFGQHSKHRQVAACLRWHDLSMIIVLNCNIFEASDCAHELAGRSACKDEADLHEQLTSVERHLPMLGGGLHMA